MTAPKPTEKTTEKTIGMAYELAHEIIITGHPIQFDSRPEDEWHNCDSMGCGWEHVVFRIPKAGVKDGR